MARLSFITQAPSETEMGVYRTLLSDDNTDWLSPDTLRANTPAAGRTTA